MYEKKKIVLDLKMNKLKEAKEKEMVTFFDMLNVVGEPGSGKNLNSAE